MLICVFDVFRKDHILYVGVQIWFSVISAIIYTVDNNNKHLDDIHQNTGHLIWLYGCIAWTTAPCRNKTLNNKWTVVSLQCYPYPNCWLGNHTAKFLKMHHSRIPYFAVQCSGCVYFHGPYSWWIERICRTSECQLDGIGLLLAGLSRISAFWNIIH